MSPHLTDDDSNLSRSTTAMNGTPIHSSPVLVPYTDRTNMNGDYHDASLVNGHSKAPYLHSNLHSSDSDGLHDIICVGFGPASLAIAVALHDAVGSNTLREGTSPKALFLEKQDRFAWHAGMLLPGAKMQISFMKDMATFRDPRSHFTFLNYLHKQDRLVEFTNLSTFLPSRVEYEDYLRWCASHFSDVVRYGEEVIKVIPVPSASVHQFTVISRDILGNTYTYKAKNVVMAIGGQPNIPKSLPQNHPRIVHSSKYAHLVPKILSDVNAPYRIAVVGAGQSAAEIFNNIQILYPNSKTALVMKQEWLKPSDDSPFVNSIFNPSFTDTIFSRQLQERASGIREAKATNYGVVRLELIEHLYERMYDQKRELGPDESKWPHRIFSRREVIGLEESSNIKQAPKLRIRSVDAPHGGQDELLDVDLVITATGYRRNAHLEMLKETWNLLPEMHPKSQCSGWDVKTDDGKARSMEVDRSYKVKFADGKVANGSGVYLQGCCEGTHGLSDTLLSVLAIRSGEIVESVFRNA